MTRDEEETWARKFDACLRTVETVSSELRQNVGVLRQQCGAQRRAKKEGMAGKLDMLAIRIENLKDQLKELP